MLNRVPLLFASALAISMVFAGSTLIATGCRGWESSEFQRAENSERDKQLWLEKERAALRADLAGAEPHERLVLADRIKLLEEEKALSEGRVKEIQKKAKENSILAMADAGLELLSAALIFAAGGAGVGFVGVLRRKAKARSDDNLRSIARAEVAKPPNQSGGGGGAPIA